MTHDQLLPALIARLVLDGVKPQVIETAVSGVTSVALGRSICGGDPLVRAFAFEQTRLLERSAQT